MKRRIITSTGIVTAIATLVFVLWPRPSVDSVMNDFFNNDAHRAEDMLIDPLILHANRVKDWGIEEIQNPERDKRRYAIGFLGIARVTEAVPVLREILADEDEKDYFRADALESIYLISESEGRSLAAKHRTRKDFLGYIANGLLKGSHQPYERSYAQALIMGHHD